MPFARGLANDTTSTDYESRITPKRVILFLDILLMFKVKLHFLVYCIRCCLFKLNFNADVTYCSVSCRRRRVLPIRDVQISVGVFTQYISFESD